MKGKFSMEMIKIKKKDILLMRLYTIFMSGIVMLYLNMCHNKNFLDILNLDYGMAQLMKNIAYLIILLLTIFYWYLYSYFWKQISYQSGVIFAFGSNKRAVAEEITIQRVKDIIICMISGILLGYICYALVLYSLGQNNYNCIVGRPVLLLAVIYGAGSYIQYKLVMSKSIVELIKVNENRFRALNKSITGGRFLAALCLLIGFAGTIYLKSSEAVITSLWRFAPILVEVIGIYLFIKYWILFSFKEITGNHRKILLTEYIRCEFRQLTLIISSVAAAAFLSIFVTTIVLCNHTLTSKEVLEYDKPFEMVFDIADNEDTLYDYLREAEDNGAELCNIKYLMGNIRWSTEKFDLPLMIIKQSDYTKLTEDKINVSAGNAVMLSQVDKNTVMIMTEADGKEWSFMPLGEIEFQCGEVQKINLTDEVWNIVFNLQDQSLRTLILNEKDYNNLISENSREINKYMINCNGKTEAKSIISTMLKNVTVDNLTVREEGINYQYAKRRIMVVFTFLTELVMLACLIIFQMLRLIAEKEKWKHSKKILRILGVEKAKLYKQIEDRMSLQTLYPAFGGGILGLAFSQIYIRKFDFLIFTSTLLIFLLTLLLEFIWRKYAVYYLNSKKQ